MMRPTPAPRSEALGAVQRRASDVGHDADAASEYTTSTLPGIAHICPKCTYDGPHRVEPGTPPHYQRLSCGACGRWLRWLSKSKQVVRA
jgi:hypothetical protein